MKHKSLKSTLLGLAALFCMTTILQAATPIPYYSGASQVYPIMEATNSFPRNLFPNDKETVAKMNAAFPKAEAPGSINAFLLFHNGKVVLIDTGLASKESAIQTTLEQLRLTARNIDIVILTHNHPDHTGNLLDTFGRPRFPNAHIWISAPELSSGRLSSAKPDPVLRKVGTAYSKRIHTFKDGQEIMPGLVARIAPGHTPGHSVLLLNDKVLFIGDLIHAARWQLPYPELCAIYDADPEQAVKSRREFLDLAADKQYVVAGAHIPFPGLLLLQKDGNGYKFNSVNLEEKTRDRQ